VINPIALPFKKIKAAECRHGHSLQQPGLAPHVRRPGSPGNLMALGLIPGIWTYT
jgi:hypothetical protein